MAGRPMKERGGDADQDEEVRSEERDATEPGESSEERKDGGRTGMHHMQMTPHHTMHHHGNIHRKDGGGISDGIDDGAGFHEKGAHEKLHGAEDFPQEKSRGGRMKHHKRAHGGAMPEHEKKKMEEHKRHKRAKGGKVPGKAAMAHPGRRARGGTADLSPYTAAGKMSVPDYEHLKTGPDERGGVGADSRGLTGRS